MGDCIGVLVAVQLMALVASTLVDLVKNLRAFAGILVVSGNIVPCSSSRWCPLLATVPCPVLGGVPCLLKIQYHVLPLGGVLCVCCSGDLAVQRCHLSSRPNEVLVIRVFVILFYAILFYSIM